MWGALGAVERGVRMTRRRVDALDRGAGHTNTTVTAVSQPADTRIGMYVQYKLTRIYLIHKYSNLSSRPIYLPCDPNIGVSQIFRWTWTKSFELQRPRPKYLVVVRQYISNCPDRAAQVFGPGTISIE